MKINLEKESNLEYNYLYNNLDYNTETGIFTWRLPGKNRVVGSQAGTIHNSGYRYIELNYTPYSEHRLAWFYCFKEWPVDQLDHIDTNRLNNCLDNLREVSNRINSTNRTNNSKYGHNIYANRSKFAVRFTINNKKVSYGSYDLVTATLVRNHVYELICSNLLPDKSTVLKELNIT